jgi:N-acetylmuramoyl-L-alanine amidase
MWIALLMTACVAPPTTPVARSAQEQVVVQAPEPPVWPEAGGGLTHPVIEVPEGFGRPGVFVVAGHGTGRNHGNTGCLCQLEEQFTLEVADDLARRLEATGIFEITRARTGTARPSYASRSAHLARSGADLMLELHSDVRAVTSFAHTQRDDGSWCYAADEDPGFAILVRDQGFPKTVARRLALARAVAGSLGQAGFPAYDGRTYGRLYDLDSTPGVFLDRRGLYMLKHADVPAILVETHNAYDTREAVRWEEEATRDAFGRAILQALIQFFDQDGSEEGS